MNKHKEIIKEYKERKSLGGVYKITNTQSGKYLLGHAANLSSIQNRFQFALTTSSAIHSKLQKDWAEWGGQVFIMEVLEELEQGPAQNQAEFMDDLLTLEQLWRAKLDTTKEY